MLMRLKWTACIWVGMHLHAASESCEGDSNELLQGRLEGSLCHNCVFCDEYWTSAIGFTSYFVYETAEVPTASTQNKINFLQSSGSEVITSMKKQQLPPFVRVAILKCWLPKFIKSATSRSMHFSQGQMWIYRNHAFLWVHAITGP